MVFMACTSGFSADVVSIAAVFTYDIYGTYINPTATGARLLKASQIAVCVWGLCMAGIAAGISQTPIGVSYLITIIGIVTACAVFPVYATILWSNQNKVAVIAAPILGSITAVASWLGSAHAIFGEVTIASSSGIYPLVIGNSVSLVSGCVYSVALTYIFGPDHFDWSAFKEIKIVDDSDVKGLSKEQLEQQLAVEHITPEIDRRLRRAKIVAIACAAILCGAFVILWPMPMYGTSYIFSKAFFRGWVVSSVSSI